VGEWTSELLWAFEEEEKSLLPQPGIKPRIVQPMTLDSVIVYPQKTPHQIVTKQIPRNLLTDSMEQSLS
jgi:hypothetical protein